MQPFTFHFLINGIMMIIVISISIYLGMKLFTMVKELLLLVTEELKADYNPEWPVMYKKKKKKENIDEIDR